MSESSPAISGIVMLDKNLVDQLNDYLEEKETQLGIQLVNVVHPLPGEGVPPDLSLVGRKRVKLSEALESVSKRIRQVTGGKKLLVAPTDWELAVKQTNTAFWEHVEVLESCSKEFFLQLGQLGIEEWHHNLMEVVDAVKEVIMHRIEDTQWALKRMENSLKEYRWACESHSGKSIFWQKLLNFRSLLDSKLYDNLQQCERFMEMNYTKFTERFKAYLGLESKIASSLEKLETYSVLRSLDTPKREKFRKIYTLLKLWSHNHKMGTLPNQDLVLALKYTCSAEKAYQLFQDYYRELRKMAFTRSRSLKEGPEEFEKDPSARKLIKAELAGMREEVRSLASTIARYREFLQRTDPNPYVRTRWGFAEGDIGQEPVAAKHMSNLGFEVENLDKLFKNLEDTFEGDFKPADPALHLDLEAAIRNDLHGIGQPLISRHHMRTKIEEIASSLLQMNELSAFDPAVVTYARSVLSKVLKADWRYHVFHEVPQFQEAYAIHQGIVERFTDRLHNERLKHFRDNTKQILHWVREHQTAGHDEQIELDINDIKVYLQDFLATAQRLSRSPPTTEKDLESAIEDLSQQLLEYRYLFSEVFYQLLSYPPEGVLIRQQFLCVDHYFESVDNLLSDLRPNKRRRSISS